MKRFLLIDDHFVVRSGINGLLSEIFNPCEIDEADDTDTASEKLKQHKYDLIMMDINMPNSDTLGFMEFVRVKYPEAKVLIFSMGSENIYARRFLKAGARGFLPKDSSLDEINKAISLVLNDRKYISESLAEILADASSSNNPDNPFDRLSPREFEVATLLLSGQTITEISRTLNLQLSTVGTHKTRVFEKLKVNNVLELKELANSYKI
jgi:two-component system, NarL family, invasion response regulator UvrY